MVNQRPTKTLFVINFDPKRTTDRDIERHFELYGRVLNVRIRRNFAFVQFDTQEDATKALECTHMRFEAWFLIALFEQHSFLLYCVTYMSKGYIFICSKLLDRVVSVEYALRDDDERGDKYYDSPRRGGYGGRGVSPYRRSPSPVYHRRPSPDYGRPGSPVYDRYNGPAYDRRRSPNYRRNRSPEHGQFRRYAFI